MVKKNLSIEWVLTLCAGIACLPWLLRYLQLDLWNDEIFSLQYFVFVPLTRTLTDYSLPNNHIFFNLLNQLFVRVFALRDVNAALAHSVWLRAWMGVYALVTVVYLYRSAAKFFNRTVAAATVILLLTSLPYDNFAVQLRGYSLSMALAAMLLYYTWSYAQAPGWKYGVPLVVSASLLLYTIPTNLYLVASLILLYGAGGALRLLSAPVDAPGQAGAAGLVRRAARIPALQVAALLGLSGVIALLLYAPVLPALFDQAGVEGTYRPDLGTLTYVLPKSLFYFLSLRFALIPFGLVGAALFVSRLKKRPFDPLSRYGLICLYLLVGPFLLSALRGDAPFDRVFIYATLFFALFVAAASYRVIDLLRAPGRLKSALFLLALLCYCQVSFWGALAQRDRRILNDLANENPSQDVFYNYFQAYYSPLQAVATLHQHGPGRPVNLYQAGDVPSALAYLGLYDLDYEDMHNLAELKLDAAGQGLVMTSTPAQFEALLAGQPALRCDPLNAENFFIVFACQRGAK